MSSSSSRLSPARHRKHSSSRHCDYGEAHVSRDDYEDQKEKRRALSKQLEEKNEELLKYHHDLGEVREDKEELSQQLQDRKKEIAQLEKELEDDRKDYDELVEERNKLLQQGKDVAKRLETCKEELATETTARRQLEERFDKIVQERNELRAKTQKRERSPSRDNLERDYKKVLTENEDIRKRLTRVLGDSLSSPVTRNQPLEALDRLAEEAKHQATEKEQLKEELERLRQEIEKQRGEPLEQTPATEPTADLVEEIQELKEELEEERKTVSQAQIATKHAVDAYSKIKNQFSDTQKRNQALRDQLEVWTRLAEAWNAEGAVELDAYLKSQAERLDNYSLEPLRKLLPPTVQFRDLKPAEIADTIRDYWHWFLVDGWNLLPEEGRQEELTTPGATLFDLTERFKKRLLRLTPDLLLLKKRNAEIDEWKEVARSVADTAAQRGDQRTPEPEQLQQIVNGLRDQLATDNQAIIFAWENASLQILPQKDDIPQTPEDFRDSVKTIISTLQQLRETLTEIIVEIIQDG